MNNKQKGFLLYLDNYDLIEDLSFEEMGRWINAVFHYKRDKEIPNFKKGSLLNTAFKVARNQLDRDAEAWEEKCQKRADAGRKGGQAKASNAKQRQAKASNAKQEVANLADNDTDNDNDSLSVTDTDTETVIETDTEQANADSDSADLLTSSATAESAEPSAGDLFSLIQIKKKVKSGKVDLSEEGVKAFYEQMQDDSWMLYGKPVEKRYLLRALREWARKHPEYMLEDEREENDSGQIQQKQAGNYKDIIEASIYKTAKGYISKRLFDENVGGHHCLIRDYCPKEAFLEVQLSYMADNWSVWPKTQKYVKKDPYLEE